MAEKMEKVFERLTLNLGGSIRHDKLEGRDHLVVPTVMIVEGVLNGSNGPLYYPETELASSEPAWNHKPIVVYHPREGSACDPVILNTRKVGVILNTKWDAPKLRTESWIDVEAANRVDKRIIESLDANKTLEVSTGLYTNKHSESGKFGEKEYDFIAKNYRPDHLAILPDQIGACSIADGAGLLQLNAETLKEGKLDSVTLSALMGRCNLRPILVENEKSYWDILSELSSQLQARFGWDASIEAAMPKGQYIVYRIRGKSELWKLSYEATDKKVTLGNNPEEVYEKTQYLSVNGEAFHTVSNIKAHEKEISVNLKQAIDALIANGGYEESDRKLLEGFPEAKVIAMAGKLAPTSNTKEPEKKPTENADVVSVPKTMFAEMTEFMANAKRQEAKAKTDLVDSIVANDGNSFQKDDLLKLDMSMLQSIAKSLKVGETVAPSYFGAQGGLVGNTREVKNVEETEAPYLPPTMNFGKEESK